MADKPKHSGYTVINGTTTGSNGSKVDTWIEYKTTQNTSANTSTVDIYLYASANKSGLTTKWTTTASYGSITLNGTSHAGASMSGGYDFTSTSIYNEFAHYSETVSHNDDGTKTITIAGSWNKGGSSSTYITGGSVASTSITLPQIPRASTISAFTGYVGTAYTIAVTRANSSYYHQLTYSFQGLTGSIGSKTNSTSISWTPSASTFLPKITGTQATGTITISTYASSSSTTVIGTQTVSLTLKIPLVTASNKSGVIGGSTTLAVTRLNNSTIYWSGSWSFGSATGSIARSNSDTATVSWANTLAQQIPNATSGTGALTIQTYHYINSSYVSIGSASYTITLTVPSSMIPTASITLAKVNSNATVNSWNIWLQGYTKVTATITGSGIQGSTITGLSVNGTGISASGTTSPLSATSSSAISSSGSLTYQGTVTDSRNRTVTASTSVTVLPYASPSLKNVSVARCLQDGTLSDSGTYLKPVFTTSVSSCDNHNTGSVSLRYKESSDSSYTTYGTVTSGTPITISGDGFEVNKTYNVQLVITDSLNNSSTSATLSVPTSERIINVNASGSGLAFGRFSSIQGALQVKYPAYFEDLVSFNGLTYRGELTSSDDLNDIKDTGIYFITSSVPLNAPLMASTYTIVFVIHPVGNFVQQLYYHTHLTQGYPQFALRQYSGATPSWHPWRYANDMPFAKGIRQITANSDLNSFTETGVYYCSSSADTQSLSHSPYTEGIWIDGTTGFRLEVYSTTGSGYGLQILYTHNVVQRTYIRALNGSTWRAWHRIVGDDEIYYRGNDTLSITTYTDLNGFITSSTTSASFSFYTPKSLANISSVTVTAFKGTLRGISGYLDSKTSAYDWFADSAYTVTATKISDNMLRIVCTKSSAFTNVTNNTPVSYYGSLGLSFSTT